MKLLVATPSCVWLNRARSIFAVMLLGIGLFNISFIYQNVADASTIISNIKPMKSNYGNIRQISLTLPQWRNDARISIQPGGPIVIDELALEQPAAHILHINDLSYAVLNSVEDINRSEIIAIKWQAKNKIIARYTLNNHVSHMKYDGRHLVVAIDKQGIEWLDVSSPNAIRRKGKFKIDGPVTALSVNRKNLAYAQQNSSIKILSVFKSVTGRVSASSQKSVHVSQSINDLWITSKLLYVSSEKTGLTLWDISKTKKIIILGGFKTTGSALGIQVEGHTVYVADGTGGLTILDATNPKNIVWRGSHSKLGRVTQVLVNNRLTIINNSNNRLASLNTDRLELPITESLHRPKQSISSVAISGTDVYLASGNLIQKIDFSQIAVTQISHSGVNQGGSRRAFIDNDIAYVADWFSGLHIYDIRIPQQPRHLGNYHTPGSSKGVVVRDSIAYIGDDDHGLQIVDVSDPRNPVKISEVLTTGLAYTLKLVNDLVYLADHRGGIHIIDVSDVYKPRIIGSFDTPGKSWALDVKDNLVFVADDLSGLLVFDTSNPSKPKQIGQFSPGGYAEDVTVVNNVAYVTFFDQGLYVLDISTPQAITEISHIDIPGNARSIAIQNDYAYIAGWESGLQIIDISRPKHLTRIGYIDTDGSTWGADVSGDYAYLWDWWGGIKVVDVSNARNPRLVGRYQGRSRILQLQNSGNYAYSANGSSGMQVFDITNPLNPIWVTGLELTGYANHITVSDNLAYLSLGDAGVAKVNIREPFNPRWLSSSTTSGYSDSIQQHKGYIYAAQKSGGIDILDARSSYSIRPIAQIADITAKDLVVTSDLLLIAHRSEISSYLLQNPANPQLLQTQKFSNPVKQLAVEKDLVAALIGEQTIQIMQFKNQHLDLHQKIEHVGNVDNILMRNGSLYIYSNDTGLHIEPIKSVLSSVSDTKKTTRKFNSDMAIHYAATGYYQSMLAHNNAILFSGQTSIASLELLPSVSWKISGDKTLLLTLPKKLPLGDYHIELELPSGQKYLYANIIQVILGKSKKSQISTEQFKKLLKQYTIKSP